MSTISFDLNIFYENTKFFFSQCNENFSIIDKVMDEQNIRMDAIDQIPK